jgi:flavin reductase (DIM6/NTAB) family NADH-FMN oxidoreductase RutF
MSKTTWKAGTMLYPTPLALVSCGDQPKNHNIITIAWAGTICSEPPMAYISVRPSRYSHELIKKTGEFVINLPNVKLARATDYCGVKSGREVNKFSQLKLTPLQANQVKAPLIDECPLNIECRVTEIKSLGSHDMFMAQVLAIHADEKYLDKKTGALDLKAADLICYSHGKYYSLGKQLGFFGYSIQKKKKSS